MNGRLLLVDDHPRAAPRLAEILRKCHAVDVVGDNQTALLRLGDPAYDTLIVSLSLSSGDGLRLCSQVRSMDRTRHLPIIMLVDPSEEARLLRGLDMGVNDYVVRPIDANELMARVRTQVSRKRHSDFLRNQIEESVEMAITDGLTGLHNRRYMEAHLKTLVEQSRKTGRPLSLLVADIDHFKRVNDTWGHDAGDQVLREFAARFRRNTRGIDLACRMGGEEFIIIMPDTDLSRAFQIGERLRACIAAEPFQIKNANRIRVTASVGLASIEGGSETPEALFKRADNALYAAKRDGRNRVIADAA
jgi:two-component system cell cycle response regulator